VETFIVSFHTLLFT